MLKAKRFTIGFLGWMILITLLSLVSFSNSSMPKIGIPHLDKVVHFTFYSVATVLGCFFVRERASAHISLNQSILIIGAFTIIYGILIEVLQHRLPGTRDGNEYDALANAVGTFVGVFVVIGIFSAKGPLKWKF